MFYKNAKIFTSDFQFHMGSFEVTDDGKFGAVLPDNVPQDAIDLQGATVIPGLIDVHSHGAVRRFDLRSCDFSSRYAGKRG